MTLTLNHTRERCVLAGLDLWAIHGREAVTFRRVGAVAGISGQRVHQIFTDIETLRRAVEDHARTVRNKSVLAQLQAGKDS